MRRRRAASESFGIVEEDRCETKLEVKNIWPKPDPCIRVNQFRHKQNLIVTRRKRGDIGRHPTRMRRMNHKGGGKARDKNLGESALIRQQEIDGIHPMIKFETVGFGNGADR